MVPPSSPPATSSSEELQRRADEARLALQPFTLGDRDQTELLAEVSACLVLVAPATMTTDGRDEWLRIALKTLNEGNYPAAAIRHGCNVARRKCRRHQDIVAKIIEEAEQRTQWLKEDHRAAEYRRANPPQPLPELEPQDERPLSIDEVRRMSPDMRKMGERAGFIPKALLDAVREEEDRAAARTH